MSKELEIHDEASLRLFFTGRGILLVNTRDNHYKYWHIEQNGNKINATWGRIGTKQRSQTKTFNSEFGSEWYIREKVYEKTKKGYRVLMHFGMDERGKRIYT